jgi:(2Fe-2S) ferredoxin
MAIKDLTRIEKHLFLCNGASCKLLGAEESTEAIREAINSCNLSEQVHTTKTLCNGRCKDGPVVILQPQGIWFKKMIKEKAMLFVSEFIQENKVHSSDVLYRYGDDVVHTS